jgi:hypothetical protein
MTRVLSEIPNAGDLANTKAFWRSDIDALSFPLEAHSASCMVHRRAFRTLLRFEPTPADCLQYFGEREQAFRMAADRKIAQNNIAVGKNLHLTSRDVARKLAGPAFENHGAIE